MCDRNLDEIPCRQRPCLPSREQIPSQASGDANAGLKGRPVLYTGVVWIGIVRRFLIPRTCYGSSLPQDSRSYESADTTQPPRAVANVQTVELPLRYQQQPLPAPLIVEHSEETASDLKSSLLRKRKDVVEPLPSRMREMMVQVTGDFTENFTAALRESQETASELVETLRSEDGQRYRLAAISASGLVGYLAGTKRGVVARLVYSATGAAAMTAICYPEDTKMYNRRGLAAVRRWIVLGLSSVRKGPQISLGGTDIGISNNNSDDDGERNASNRNVKATTNSFSTENIIANLMKSLGTLGDHLEEIKTKLREIRSTTVANESTIDVVSGNFHLDTSIESSAESPVHLQTDCVDDRFAMNDKLPGSVPHMPSLSIHSKVGPGQSKHKVSLVKKGDEDLGTSLEESTSIFQKRSSQFLQSHATHELSRADDDDGDDDDEEDDDEGDFRDLTDTFIIPTGGLEEKLEGRKKHQNKIKHSTNSERPLNKKLSAYYKDMPEDEKTSREKGYVDAYSNRGK